MNTLKKPSRAGWRAFTCPDCNDTWKEATRDCFSPSGENCPKCGGWAMPSERYLDSALKTDNMGNLLKKGGRSNTLEMEYASVSKLDKLFGKLCGLVKKYCKSPVKYVSQFYIKRLH